LTPDAAFHTLKAMAKLFQPLQIPGHASRRPDVDPVGSSAARLLKSLEGRWTLSRTVDGFGKMNGFASFRRVLVGLEYREEGILTLDSGSSHSAFRRLFYCEEDEAIVIRFPPTSEPGAILHRLALIKTGDGPWPLEAADTHHCGQDTYHGIYIFETPVTISTEIAVRGPKKNTTINTLLRKSASSRQVAAKLGWRKAGA
jgi:hypothetical protein